MYMNISILNIYMYIFVYDQQNENSHCRILFSLARPWRPCGATTSKASVGRRVLGEDDVISSFSNWKMKTCQISQMMVWEVSLRGDVQRLASFCWGGS